VAFGKSTNTPVEASSLVAGSGVFII